MSQQVQEFQMEMDLEMVRESQMTQTITSSTDAPSIGSSLDRLSSVSSLADEPYAVTIAEARAFYAGLPSTPRLIYRSEKKEWFPPSGLEAYHRKKQLGAVFEHPIVDVWKNGLGWKVVNILDAHKVRFTSIDVVRFILVDIDEEDATEERVSPVTIWIGVFGDWISPSLAHEAAQDILALLKEYNMTDVNVHFRDSIHASGVGPQLFQSNRDINPVVDVIDPITDVIGPLTATLGLPISTAARPDAQGTMTLYLKKDVDSNDLFGLSCRHVLIDPVEPNDLYIHHRHAPLKSVLLLSQPAYPKIIKSIEIKITDHSTNLSIFQRQIEKYVEREQSGDADEDAKAKAVESRATAEVLIKATEKALVDLAELLRKIQKDWKSVKNRVIGHVVYSPPIAFGVGPGFTEDWGLFKLDQAKLGNAYYGNKLDLGTKMSAAEFTRKCFPRGDANWNFTYPIDRLLPLSGTITDEQMRHPNMWDSDGELCILVVKRGNATDTTIGRANGVLSIIRKYSHDTSIVQTSMEWAILPYSSKSEPFSAPGDSGSIIADIRGRIGGMLTGGVGNSKTFDITYATPWWWLLQQIKVTTDFAEAYVA